MSLYEPQCVIAFFIEIEQVACSTNRPDAWEKGSALHDLAVKRRRLSCGDVVRKSDIDGQNVPGVKTQVHMEHRNKASDQESRSREQKHGEREFGRDEQAFQASALSSLRYAASGGIE